MLDRRLLYVVATARRGSFTAAAAEVGVTQSAITKSVADLERQIGYVIFNRTARGVILTEDGQSFVERSVRILDETRELLRGSFTGSDPYAGVLKIGICPASIEWLLVEPLSTLTQRHKSIRLDITGSNFDRTAQELRAGAIDVAVGFEAAFREQPDFRCEALAGPRTSFFVRSGHPILEREEVTLADLARYEMISPSSSRPYDSFMHRIYEDAGIEARTKLHFIDYFPIVARLVSQSDAIALVASDYTETPSFKRRFTRVPFLETRPLSPLAIAIRSRWTPRPAVRAFIKACRERLPAIDAQDETRV
ncbi:LysR family transcriptional regulator [Novosphingobium sp. PC22D]|nr:LysR family transcriptional regulator [Novosphingobium sp. PC22D]